MGPVEKIMAAAKPDGGEEEAPDMEGKEMAAEAVMDALNSKDAMALAMALSDFIDMCKYDKG